MRMKSSVLSKYKGRKVVLLMCVPNVLITTLFAEVRMLARKSYFTAS
jgi:hypothetical protein